MLELHLPPLLVFAKGILKLPVVGDFCLEFLRFPNLNGSTNL